MSRGIVAAILELVSEFHPLIMLHQDPSFANIAVSNASYHHKQPNLQMLTIFSIFTRGYVSILSSELPIRDQYAVSTMRIRSYSATSSVFTYSSCCHYVDDILLYLTGILRHSFYRILTIAVLGAPTMGI
jgi:hypothetical protein